ncbi:MAG: SsrA-binding protein SmpB [Planctomycetes bacterium]|nr:SsrA-binding protein SmpB [Planctomycetota bacterium]
MARKPDNAAKGDKESSRIPVTTNRRAFYQYHVMERFEAGLKLLGSEVKSLRAGHCEISDAYASVDKDRPLAWLHNLQIPLWQHASIFDRPEPKRKRALLLHKREIEKIREALTEKGLTLIPLGVYFHNGFAKVELAICKGKKLHDKREAIKEKDAKREIARRVKR